MKNLVHPWSIQSILPGSIFSLAGLLNFCYITALMRHTQAVLDMSGLNKRDF